MRLVDTGPVLDLRIDQLCVHWDPETRSPSVTSCLHVPSSPLSQVSGLLEDPLWAHVPIFFEESSLPGLPGSERFRKQKEQETVALGAAGWGWPGA